MKVLNLQCSHQHSFEGWFASEDDFQAQLTRGLIECPLCADKGIQKMPSAPHLNLGAPQVRQPALPDAATETSSAVAISPKGDGAPVHHHSDGVTAVLAGRSQAEQAAFLKALRHVVANTEDVGEHFADEARRMHYGERQARSIRGQTSVREAVALLEEGIEVMPLPLPVVIKETLQ